MVKHEFIVYDHASYTVIPLLAILVSKHLTLRVLMSYIYIYMEHPFLMFLDHTR
jgi:hypothetical protein